MIFVGKLLLSYITLGIDKALFFYFSELFNKKRLVYSLKVCGQNANRTKCQPKVGIFAGLFIVIGILSVPIFG